MDVRALATVFAVACGGHVAEGNDRVPVLDAAGGIAGRDARGGSGAGGTAGVILVDASQSDTSLTDTCSPDQTLRIESEDAGAWCSIPLPKFPRFNPMHINIRFKAAEGERWLGYVSSAEECASDATAFLPSWYYYEKAGVTRIGFCPDACAWVLMEGNGSVTVVQGCSRLPGP